MLNLLWLQSNNIFQVSGFDMFRKQSHPGDIVVKSAIFREIGWDIFLVEVQLKSYWSGY